MYDGAKIITGLGVFLAIVSSPAWYHWWKGTGVGTPELKFPTDRTECVAPTPYMRLFHMDLLDAWREEAIRTSDRTYLGLGGVEYDKSLSATCLRSCHSERQEFCDRCHQHVGAEPYCWDCHAEREIDAMVKGILEDPRRSRG